MRWREVLVEAPAAILDVAIEWAWLYFRLVLYLGVLVPPIVVLIALIAWLFGVRWGW